MKNYIGAKIIKAERMGELTFFSLHKPGHQPPLEDRLGYHVQYPDGYNSWSPKEVFENAYRPITDGEMHLISPAPEKEQGDSPE